MTLDSQAFGGQPAAPTAQQTDSTPARAKETPSWFDASLVGPRGITLLLVYVMLLTVSLLYILVQIWPLPVKSASSITPMYLLGWTFLISDDGRLLLVVALAGALGGLIHVLRSAYWYIGNRELVRSWLAMYILLPFVGSVLSLIFYLVIRGGFFSAQATVQQTSPYGFAAVASLVGMFTPQAVLKLKQVAETVLAKPPEGHDAVPQEPATAVKAADASPVEILAHPQPQSD